MTEEEAVLHIKKQYQKMFMQREKAQELFDYMKEGDDISKFTNRFNVNNVNDFINDIVSDLSNDELYGFVNVK